MIRALIINLAGVTLLVALFFVVVFIALIYTVPARAGECRGTMVRASWYGAESGSKTAAGAHFNGSQWLVAHRSLPFGTKLRLTYHGHSVVVPVGDRGPYIKGRTLDLSHAVAKALGTIPAGVAKVCMERLS